MSTSSRIFAAGILSLVFSFLAFVLFLALCWAAAADAQGAIAFIFYAPVLIIFLWASFSLGKYASKTIRLGTVAQRISLMIGVFIFIFYLSPFVGLNVISDGVIKWVANSFEAITGKTPMQWDKNL